VTQRVYLDYNASTPVCAEALKAFAEAASVVGNASSVHLDGQSARHRMDDARQGLASIFQVHPQEIVFTSGATEANNLAMKGIARHARSAADKRHVLVSAIEHPSVLDAAGALRAEGFEVQRIPVHADGRADLEALKGLLRPDTAVAALMRVNNETGVIQPTDEAAALCAERGVPLHVDWVQAFGKLPVSLAGCASASFTAHKAYGPKGIGALYVARRTKLLALTHGGPQENNLRAGTESPELAAAFCAAARVAERLRAEGAAKMRDLRTVFLKELETAASGWALNGDPARTVPQTISLRFDGSGPAGSGVIGPSSRGSAPGGEAPVDGTALVRALDLAGFSVSSGSACAAGSVEPSHVLEAMGLEPEAARASLRVSFGHFTPAEDLAECARTIGREAARLRAAGAGRS
jgi:cysteine desulfurase